ncbi:MAG: T9SS type A sorting domain-containing protein [Dysgonamonadaceae bacterium]|jgi:hypothetical protein|nr:T9SS type A sorting domain-containing protein [Dysgonamonadaceae bacterium]
MRRLVTLLVLAVILGLNIAAQNTKPNARIESVHGKEASLNQKGKLETPVNPLLYERMQADKKNELSVIRENGKIVLRDGENHAAGKQGIFRAKESKKEPVKRTPAYKIGHPSVVKSTNEDAATITLKVIGDPWEDGTGFQALMDADHAIDLYAISSFEELYDMCEYTIPEGASADVIDPVMVLDDEVSIDVSEGLYDIIFLNPDQNYGDIYICLWYDTEEPAFGDDFSFKAGYEYIFIIEYAYLVEYYPPIDAALTKLVLPQASPDLTDSEEIGVVLSNVGTQPVSSVELSYRINDGETVTETYTETLAPGAEVTYTFNAKADFSEAGLYTVTAWLTYEEDMNSLNNQLTGIAKHSVPLPLPFDCGFDSPDDLTDYWAIIDGDNANNTWLYDDLNVDADGGVGALQVSAPGDNYLISDPLIFPEAGAYHITFQTMALATESLKVLYGPSANVEEMEVLADYTLPLHYDWLTFGINFEVPEAGNYHVAFYYYSDVNGWALDLDNIFVDEGVFVGIPDLTFANLLTPGSSCNFSSGSVLGATVLNNGNEPVSEFTLTYQVNDGQVVSETFNEAIGVLESKAVYFTQPADFSTLGNYEIVMTVSTPNEENTSDNSASASLTHYAPVTELPFKSDFANPEDRNDWTSTGANVWGANDYNGCLYPTGYYPLLSRCIALQPGNYRFTYTYAAGWFIFTDDFYVAYGLSGTDPAGWTPVKEYFNEYTDGQVEDEIVLNITEAGEYVIGIFPVEIGDLGIFKTSVTVFGEHDVRINGIESPSLPRKIPFYQQIEGEKTFNVFVQNRGTGTEAGSVELKLNNNSLGTANFTLATPDEVKAVPLSITLPALPIGPLNLQFKASIEASDPNPDDNIIQIQKAISDSTYVWDNIDSDFFDGIGANNGTAMLGLIYELVKKDVLTSINIGLFDYGISDDFGIAVYPVDDELVLGEPYFTQVHSRLAGSSIVFDVPDTELEPGKYLFAVQQLTNNNIAIAYDADPNGYFYGDFGIGLELINGFGFIHIRPNFGKNVVALPEVKAIDPSLQLYPNPVVDLLWVRVANQRIEKVSVYDASGATVYREQGINNSEYKLNTGSLAPGLYFITVQTPAGVKTDKFVVKK